MKNFFILCLGLIPNMALSQGVDEFMKVTLRDNRFHVLDKDGFPVRGLEQKDFNFFIGKTALNLNYFEEVDLLEEPESSDSQDVLRTEEKGQTAKQSIVIILDSSNMDQFAFPRVKEGLENFLQNSLNPNSRVKLVQLEKKMVHFTEFTTNVDLLVRKLREMEYQGSFRRELERLDTQLARAFEIFARENDTNSALGSDDQGRENSLGFSADQVNDARRDKELLKYNHFLTYMYNMQILGDIMAPMTGDKSIYLFTGGQYLEQKGQIRNTYAMASDLAQRLNSQGVTIYSYLHQSRTVIGQENWRMTQLGLLGQTDAMLAIQKATRFSDLSETDIYSIGINNALVENQEQMLTGPRETASQTGGLFKYTVGDKALYQDINDFLTHTQHYYRFTYSIDQEHIGKKLKIKFANPSNSKEMKLYFGKEFKPEKPFSQWNEVDRLLAFEQIIRFQTVFRDEMGWEYGCTPFWLDPSNMAISVFTGFKTNMHPKDGYEVGFAAFDEAHVIQDVIYETVFPPESNEEPLFYNVLLTQKPPSFIRFFVRNLDTGDVSFQEMPIKTDSYDPGTSLITGLSLGHDQNYKLIPINHIPSSSKAWETKKRLLRSEKDPYSIKTQFFKPTFQQSFHGNDLVPIFFHFLGAKLKLNQYSVGFSIEKDGQVFAIPGTLLDYSEISEGNYKLVGQVQLPDLVPNSYHLRVELYPNDDSEKKILKETTFLVN